MNQAGVEATSQTVTFALFHDDFLGLCLAPARQMMSAMAGVIAKVVTFTGFA
jgi:hypothetical protein